ncbi:uncharacterized protein PITG_16131 [Phytophthora infestans T30-4]|uniref:WIBG Mago-binding domain-containing protein n=1 Tax=Phytophthora infestans (strain T30-4) TaxID=403677 RepID=D0NSY9_PHYIT|nr:uncharacterized protein PITG_16131 [Phytophthora infestans T30-4]EEY64701.1 conserved hypothetical protein [Phytophthora infestans T30-4]|eukprot:XP_002897901.1 conserved hypothetical protein [Phytophthora infestans T30-4]
MTSTKNERLPLGAVRTADGVVVVPASRRADGSTRKSIRIRQGYVPQDEVPKYKTVAQREVKRESKANLGGDSVVDELQIDKLSLEQKKEIPKERPRTRDPASRQEQECRLSVENTRVLADTNGDRQKQLKRHLTKTNKQLKDIAKLVDAEINSLTSQQKQKIARKSALQQERNDIIAELNGATVTRSSNSTTGPRPKVAISL